MAIVRFVLSAIHPHLNTQFYFAEISIVAAVVGLVLLSYSIIHDLLSDHVVHKPQPIDANLTFSIPQFRALSDQLYQTPDNHEFVREQIISQVIDSSNLSFVNHDPQLYSLFSHLLLWLINNHFQLKSNREAYDGYVPMAYDEYLEKVSR